jgi:RHS repeat-associated protein
VLSDGHALYTPGLSENRNGVSSYYANDRLGNLWTVEGSGKSQSGYEDTTGFGTLTALAGIGGAGGTPFGYGGGNGCQTDADTGLILMGHRYYDTRIGRFISQGPAGDGDNWYAYARNNPTNEIDSSGLTPDPNPNEWSLNGGSQLDGYNVMAESCGYCWLNIKQRYNLD